MDILQHGHLPISLVVWNIFLKGVVASTDSQGQIALLQLDGDSHIGKEIKILLDVDNWYCDI